MLKDNFKKIYLFNATWAFLLIQPLVVPFFQSKGLSMSQVFTVITAFSLTLSILDIPTGYFSDRMGRRLTLILASLFKGIGGMVLAFSQGFFSILVSYILIGIGNSLYSGSDISLLHETNASIPPPLRLQSNKMFGRRFYFAQVGLVLASVMGGIVGAYSLDWAVRLNAVFAWVPLLIAFSLEETPRLGTKTEKHFQYFKKLFHELWWQSYEVKVFLLLAILYGAIPIVSTFALQGLLSERGLSLSWFGYIFAILSTVGALSSRHVSSFEKVLGRRGSYLLIVTLTPLALLGCSFPFLQLVLISALALEIVRGLGQALFMDQVNGYLSSDIRATGNSVVSLGTRLSVAGLGPLSGAVSDRFGISKAFLALGIVYFLLFFLFFFFGRLARNG